VQITPKAADTNLLFLLRYAHGSTATTFDKRTAFEEGPTFLDALGTLFEAELDRLLNRGLHTDYRRTEGTEQQLRGQLDMQRQLQRQPPKPTKFECRYDELTHDIVANRAVLYAATLLLGLVADEQVTRQLRAHQQTMRRQVELTPITVADIDALHLDRLAAHYTDILRLARLVIANGFVGELQAGPSTALAMLVNMNTVYENAVERAFREAVANRTGWVVKGQDETKSLITRGGIDVTLRPDVVVNDATGATRVVADAKWKTKTPPNSDYYQMTSYMLDRDASGLLVYPDCGGANAAALEVANRFDLTLCELPTAADVDSYSAFTDGFVAAAEDAISALL
jgi:5-methylcytosine-specific restriction enzyme subunit McrC